MEDVQDDWLSTGWSPDTHTHGLIEAYAESDTPKSGRTWIADLVSWPFLNGRMLIELAYAGRRGVSQILMARGNIYDMSTSPDRTGKILRISSFMTTVCGVNVVFKFAL